MLPIYTLMLFFALPQSAAPFNLCLCHWKFLFFELLCLSLNRFPEVVSHFLLLDFTIKVLSFCSWDLRYNTVNLCKTYILYGVENNKNNTHYLIKENAEISEEHHRNMLLLGAQVFLY